MSRRARVLVVEDDATLREGLRTALVRHDLDVVVARDGTAGAAALADRDGYDCVLLDLMLPGRSGLDLLREFRARDVDTPVVILTARGDETDKVLGLELGADDYVTKPFSLRELIARVRAQLRRSPRIAQPRAEPAEAFVLGGARVDLAAFLVVRDGAEHSLSPKEAGILDLLWRERGRAVSRDAILDAVWGRGIVVAHRTIDTHVLHLRQKLGEDPRAPRFVRTVHGVGYRLVVDGGGAGGTAQ